MRYIIALFLFFQISSSYAEVKSIERSNGDIILTTSNCEELNNQVQTIAKWSKWSEGKDCTVTEKKGMWLFGNKRCVANISKCLPDHVSKYHGINPDISGPNCWNLSLVMAGILPNLRYSTPEEMSFFMSPPLCNQLKSGEERRPGDIGTIRRNRGQEVHGFVYISEELAYSKNGYHKSSPYALQTLDNVYDVYNIKNTDKKCLGNVLDPTCESGVEYFRCNSMKEYLAKERKSQSKPSKEVLVQIDRADCLTSHIALNGSSFLEGQLVSTMASTVISINELLYNDLYKEDPETLSEVDTFILASTKLRIKAIGQQLNMATVAGQTDADTHAIDGLIDLLERSQRELYEISKK
jgi:hypothetical protein